MFRSKKVGNNANVPNPNLLTVGGPKKAVSYMSLQSKTKSSRRSYDLSAYESAYDLLPSDLSKYENTAPEISHLRIHRDAYSDDDDVNLKSSVNLTRTNRNKGKCCLSAFCSRICSKCRRSDQNGKDLDDLDPIHPRTANSVDYIKTLAEQSTNMSAKSTEEMKNIEQALLIKKAYKAALDGLMCINSANESFKYCILMLTFSQHSSNPLGKLEKTIIRGKTILGSYAWMATFMLQQMQFDAELEVGGYSTSELKEIVRLHEKCVCLSLYIWEAMIHLIEAVEHTHEYVEKVFSDLLNKVGEQSTEASMTTARHIKAYRKFQRRKDELDQLKTYDSKKYAQTWAKFSSAPSRILMLDSRTKATAEMSWVTFDVQPPSTKFYVIKQLYRQIEKISGLVLEHVEDIANCLHTVPLGRKTEKKHRNISPSTVRSFEDGVFLMNKYLDESSPKTWNAQQIESLLEVDKISLDRLDLLTLSTATMRTLTHEARHILHVTYETIRDFDFSECKTLNSYEEIVESCRNDFPAMWEKATAEKEERNTKLNAKSTSSVHRSTEKRRHYESKFDIEESVLEAEDAEHFFERSIYQDIIKEVPICLQGSISLTLQDAELVFTESSQDILSTIVHE